MDRRTTAIALGIASAGVAFFASRRSKKDVTVDRAHSTRAVTIRATPAALYAQWTEPGHLAEFYRGVEMEIVANTPGKRYEWRTVASAPFTGGGSLTFTAAPGDRGTEARLALFLEGPGAHPAAAFARIFGAAPAQIAMESLRAFKSIAETGEVAKADRQ